MDKLRRNPRVRTLKRGGLVVKTSAGLVQFGIPPETIKDTMTHKGGVPGIFVAVEPLFSHERGISFCELEFPIYFNFYVLKRKIRVVCTREMQPRLATFISEAAFGPESFNLMSEFVGGRGNRAMPDLRKEMDYFRKNPFNNGEPTQMSDIVEFELFDEKGYAALGDGVELVSASSSDCIEIIDGGRQIARIPKTLPLPAVRGKTSRRKRAFYPPLFGVTVIGSGHGFDPTADTSGFVLWVNHRGIIVDPPVDSTEWLSARQVPRQHVNALILTHCHADHDAGTLKKLFQEQNIPIYTSNTIMEGFVRKASAITGLNEHRIRSLIDHHPVTMGAPVRINGAEFRFHYTLHSVPSISFEVYFLGKSFVYSGDTLNDPAAIDKLDAAGVFPPGRRDALLNFPWHHSLIFHEAGVPPLHTPVERLVKLPDDVKKRLFLLHVGKDSVPPGANLVVAEPGVAQTIRLHVEKSPHSKAIELLNTLGSVDLFRDFPISRAADFLGVAQIAKFEKDQVILKEGDAGTQFFLILSGTASIQRDTDEIEEYGPNDYFGETALVMDIPRSACAVAKTDMTCIVLDKGDFLYLIRGTDVALKLRRLFINRQLGMGDVLGKTEPFTNLTPTQRTHIESYMDSDFAMAGHHFLKQGDRADRAYVLAEGQVLISRADGTDFTIDRHCFIADIETMLHGGRFTFSAQALSDVRLFAISRKELLHFVDLNPGFYFRLSEHTIGVAPRDTRS